MLVFVLAVLFLGLRLMSEKGQQIIAGEEADQLVFSVAADTQRRMYVCWGTGICPAFKGGLS